MTNLSDHSENELEQELAKRKIQKNIPFVLETDPLKMKKVTRLEVDSSDFEKFIYHIFGKTYESAMVEECSNDTSKTYKNIDGKDQSYNVSNVKIEQFLYGANIHGPDMRSLLNYLVYREYIPAGDYTIVWSW